MANITPTSFLDRKGINQSAEIYKNRRPPKNCHLSVRAVVSTSKISEAFDKDSKCSMNYFLSLPQSFGPIATIVINCKTPNIADDDMFSRVGNATIFDDIKFTTPHKKDIDKEVPDSDGSGNIDSFDFGKYSKTTSLSHSTLKS